MILKPIVNNDDIDLLINKDPNIEFIYKNYGAPPNWQREPNFVSLIQIILEQQVSLASAKAHFKKLEEYVGKISPQSLLKLNDAEFKDCYISRQKSSYLRNVATATVEEKLKFEDLKKLSDDEVKKHLIQIKGIGQWTANVYLMMCLQRKNILLENDIAIVNTTKKLYQKPMSQLKKQWNPLNSLATCFLWHYYLSK